ncbi:MAG: hypothetical protein U0992_13015 [Planctomycetaceae bacterium]
MGVKGINLASDDEVVSMVVADPRHRCSPSASARIRQAHAVRQGSRRGRIGGRNRRRCRWLRRQRV